MELTFLITAGATREYLDPVRFFSNASSGRMGYALAKATVRRGHKTVLISGPCQIKPPEGITCVPVVSAREMLREVKKNIRNADVFISAAAVSDYRPAKISRKKIKKTAENLEVKLIMNPDILQYVGIRNKDKVIVGFALESENLINSAKLKMAQKKLDMVVANYVSSIGGNKTSACIIQKDGRKKSFKNVQKTRLAEIIIDESVRIWENRKTGKKLH